VSGRGSAGFDDGVGSGSGDGGGLGRGGAGRGGVAGCSILVLPLLTKGAELFTFCLVTGPPRSSSAGLVAVLPLPAPGAQEQWLLFGRDGAALGAGIAHVGLLLWSDWAALSRADSVTPGQSSRGGPRKANVVLAVLAVPRRDDAQSS
jgi:hypothetical protein